MEDFRSCSRILVGTIRTRLSCSKAALLCRRSVAQSSTEMRAHLGSADCYWFSLACTAPKVHQCTAAYQVQTKYCSCCSSHSFIKLSSTNQPTSMNQTITCRVEIRTIRVVLQVRLMTHAVMYNIVWSYFKQFL